MFGEGLGTRSNVHAAGHAQVGQQLNRFARSGRFETEKKKFSPAMDIDDPGALQRATHSSFRRRAQGARPEDGNVAHPDILQQRGKVARQDFDFRKLWHRLSLAVAIRPREREGIGQMANVTHRIAIEQYFDYVESHPDRGIL